MNLPTLFFYPDYIAVYIVFGFVWGTYAWAKQTEYYGYLLWRNILTTLLNGIFWPICMIIAATRAYVEKKK